MNQTVKDALDDINTLLDAYKPFDKYLGYVGAVACFVIGAVLTVLIGEAWSLLLIILSALPIYLGSRASTGSPSEKDLAEAVCQLMSFCVSEANQNQTALSYGLSGNEGLYKNFISLYPYMASYKLTCLASIKIGL